MKQTLTTVNSLDHQTLHGDYYHTPDSKGLVVVFHGMAEHKARYEPFAKTLIENDFCVLLCDHRGHGQSLFNNKIKGHFADEDGWMRNVADLHELILQAKVLSDHQEIVLIGHSMGSMFARSYFKRHNDTISHLVLSGIPAIPNNVTLLESGIKLITKNSRQKPNKFLYKSSFGSFDKKSGKEHPLSWLSNDPEKVQAYRDDPLCGFYFTGQGFADLAFGMKDVVKVKDYPSNRNNTSIRLIVGEDDVTVDMDQLQSMIITLQSKGYENPSVRLIPNAAHEVLFEDGKEHLWQQIIQFIQP